jgi:hypothetical protein
LVWADNAIPNKNWLEVTVKASTTTTGLAADDVFYFGNAIGETGNSGSNTNVDATDELAARNNPRNSLSPFGFATVTNVHDFNKDRSVNATDELIARNNPANTLAGRLNLIDLTGVMLSAPAPSPVIDESAPVMQSAPLSLAAPIPLAVEAQDPMVTALAEDPTEPSSSTLYAPIASNISKAMLPSESFLQNSSQWLVLSSAHTLANLVNAFKASTGLDKVHSDVWASFDLTDHGDADFYADDDSYCHEIAMNLQQQKNARTTKRDKTEWFSEAQIDAVLDTI